VLRPHETAAKHSVVSNQEHETADGRYEQAITIETGGLTPTEQIRKKAAKEGPEDTQKHIANEAMACLVNDFATNETNYPADKDPGTERQDRTALQVSY
jgi:hypothetical protein